MKNIECVGRGWKHFERIQSHMGVVGAIVVNNEGILIKNTLGNTSTVQYAGLLSHLLGRARSVDRGFYPSNNLTFIRVRSKEHEIMVAPYGHPKSCKLNGDKLIGIRLPSILIYYKSCHSFQSCQSFVNHKSSNLWLSVNRRQERKKYFFI